jgi:predicted HTH domain antitoxin
VTDTSETVKDLMDYINVQLMKQGSMSLGSMARYVGEMVNKRVAILLRENDVESATALLQAWDLVNEQTKNLPL